MMAQLTRLSAALNDRYRIERELGAGGMATVYLAEDLKHKRKVALKVLKPELAAVLGADRFVQEITTTASLQHPHILPLFDSGTADGFLFYVMPFIEGETLRDKLNRETQLGVDEAVRIARDVADALDYAHRRGVIHRDIKPENILLHDGRPMVADFGIALAVSAAAGGRMTETGLSLGTPHYMSPEQATAEKEITGRSDVYSLASLLYEMLTGNPPHVGSSAQQIIMKIIAEPMQPVTALRKSVPPNVAAALTKALEKLPADRFATAKEFADALINPSFIAAGSTVPKARAVHADSRSRLTAPLLTLAVVATVVGAWGWLRPQPVGERRQLVVDVPRLSRILSAVISPTGTRMAFTGDGRLWIRDLDDRAAHALEGTDGAMAPFWSPDGSHIAYFVGNRIFRVAADGGAPSLVTSIDMACPLEVACGGSWTNDGTMLLSSGFSKLLVVSERGGQAQPYVTPAPGEHFHQVAALPNGRGAVFDVDPDHGTGRIDVWNGRERRVLLENASSPRYADLGYVVFIRDGGIWAVRLKGTALEGDAFPVVDRGTHHSVSRSGALLYTAPGTYEEQLVWVDRGGVMREAVASDDGVARNPALSPDESRIAFNGKAGVRIHVPSRGVRMALGGDDKVQTAPVWAPTGDRVYYESVRAGARDQEDALIRATTPGTGATVTITDSGFDPAFSADGRYLTYTTGNVSNQDLWFVDLRAPSSTATAFSASPEFASALRVSPDGRHAAFVVGDWTTGKFEIYLSRFPGGQERTQVSSGGISYLSRVYWSAAGDQLYYVRGSDGALMTVDVNLASDIGLSTPRVLFTESTADLSFRDGLAVSRDPSRFLAVRRTVRHGGTPTTFVLLENWSAPTDRSVKR
jgi:Tol biopolymer transport system component/tRNA A-37 threonylcarbamoyl transferase component Bud32